MAQTTFWAAVMILPASVASDFTVPASHASSEGDVAELSLLGLEANRVQIAYSASLLDQAGVRTGARIVGLSLRLDGDQPVGLEAQTVPNYTVILSTPRTAVGSMDSVFANNLGPDAITVRTGPLTFEATDYSVSSHPRSFGTPISFQTEYIYQGGALLLDFSHDPFPGIGASVDAVSVLSTDQAQALFGSAGSMTADLGNVPGAGAVLRLITSDVPEPGDWPVAVGFACAGWCVWRRWLRSAGRSGEVRAR